MAHGLIALFGSGETSKRGRRVHEYLFCRLPVPVRVAIVETPAGFQPNVTTVSNTLRTFFVQSLRNFQPQVEIVAARHRDGVYDPNSPAITKPLEHADYIFSGPGSPSYAVRHLTGTRTLDLIRGRLVEGSTLSLSSAAAIAFGRWSLPVYEIYKVGADLHWLPGIDIFRGIGLDLTVLPHWNNTEGGASLDTSHCFMGAERFGYLRRMLPGGTTLLGIDEHTACVLDPNAGEAMVLGAGTVTVIRDREETVISNGERFSFDLL